MADNGLIGICQFCYHFLDECFVSFHFFRLQVILDHKISICRSSLYRLWATTCLAFCLPSFLPSSHGDLTPVMIAITVSLPFISSETLAPQITFASSSRLAVTCSPILLTSSSVMSGPPSIWINAPVAPS